jgi:hypothetical protein
MSNRKAITAISLVLFGLSTTIAAQEVYRCGNSYSQQACPDAVVVDVADPRTPEQKAQADEVTQRAAAAAQAMEQERLKQEELQRARQAAAKPPAKQAKQKPKAQPKAKKPSKSPTNPSTAASPAK